MTSHYLKGNTGNVYMKKTKKEVLLSFFSLNMLSDTSPFIKHSNISGNSMTVTQKIPQKT